MAATRINGTRVQAVARGIRGRAFAGSSIENGTTYQEIPGSGVPFHRGGTRARAQQIARHVELGGRSVLDLGASVGALSLELLRASRPGGRMHSVDWDPQSLAVARELRRDLGDFGHLEKAASWKISQATIDLDYTRSMPTYDVVVWLSQFMWAAKQWGLETALDMLFEISKRCEVLVFESAASDGEAPIRGATQRTLLGFLDAATCFESIHFEPSAGRWIATRLLFVCRVPRDTWHGETSTVRRIGRRHVVKQYKPGFEWMAPREAEALRRLEELGAEGFPRVVGSAGSGGRVGLSWAGRAGWVGEARRRLPEYRQQGEEICAALEQARIRHRDIRPANLCLLDGRVSLIDFGWCLLDDEPDTPTPAPGCLGTEPDGRRWGSTDALAMASVFAP